MIQLRKIPISEVPNANDWKVIFFADEQGSPVYKDEYGNTYSPLGNTKNDAWQIKANYWTSLQISNFTASTPKTFDIITASPSLSSYPTTTFPYSSPQQSYADMFDDTRGNTPTGRLIENPLWGQVHHWRIQGNYSNKWAAQQWSLKIRLRNPVSGFIYDSAIVMADWLTTDTFNVILICIADSASIPSPNWYILDAVTSFTDSDFTVAITSITRISFAIENQWI